MAKTTKSERRAFDALDDAAAAAKTARKVAKDLPPDRARSLREAAAKAKDVAGTSDKAVRAHPKKVRRRAEKSTARVQRITQEALADVENETHQDAAQQAPAVAEPTAPAVAPDELSLLTVAELRSRARSQGRTGYSRLSKAQLVELLG